MHSIVSPRQNHLIGALPVADFERLSGALELVPMPLGKVLHEPGDRLPHVFFPTTCIVSLLYTMEDGGSAEVALVGNDGMIGIALFMGGDTMPNRAVVVSAGFAYRMHKPVLMSEFNRGDSWGQGALRQLLLRYTQALVTQTAQTAVCNRHHSVAQQLCRWLLLAVDRSPGNELAMTHELIASMLGVRREGITEAAGRLQMEGIIQYTRGHITILNRSGLELRVCECYAVVRKECERLLPPKSEKAPAEIRYSKRPMIADYDLA
jgi:CRP-like cAMP-binding protein